MNTPYFNNTGKYLILADNVSDITKGVVYSLINSGSVITCVTTNQHVKNYFNSIGITCVLTNVIRGKDEVFFDNYMPGSLEEIFFDGFPLWKGLSIDRFRFWHINKDNLHSLLSKLNFDTIIFDFDLMSNVSVIVEYVDNDLVLIKNRTLREAEKLDFMITNKDRIKTVITNKKDDAIFINDILDDANIKVWGNENKVVLPTERDARKSGELVYYDKKYIWQFNEFIKNHKVDNNVVSFDQRSIDLFSSCHDVKGVNVVDPTIKNTPEKLFMFDYDEEIIDKISPSSVIIFDYHGVNRSKILANGDERVVVYE